MLSIELNDDEHARLNALAAHTGRAPEEFVREAVAMHLDELEDIAWAEGAAREWNASDKKIRPLSEIRRELGL